MGSDDGQIGRLLTRREAIALMGASSAALLAGCGAQAEATSDRTGTLPSCIVRPEQTEGPYFVDEKLNRSDIRSDPVGGAVMDGAPLQLQFRVSRVRDGACTPLSRMHVDLWQCNAVGVYSDVRDPNFNTVGQKFQRGYQVTDADGVAKFITIYPGWYQGRTVHLHFKVRTAPSAARGHEFTSQLYFDDALTDRVHTRAAYASKGQRTTRNRDDRIFRNGGDRLMLALREGGDGFEGSFDLGLAIA